MENMQEILQVDACIKARPWLIRMVKSKLFHTSCDQHITKQLCYFCCNCMIKPLCDLCYRNSKHENHTTIQTYKCSQKSGVRTETISKYMNISGIHKYTINSKEIVFINQRRSDDNHRCRKNITHKCVVCEWELDATSALVCSIECKFRFALGPQLDEMMENPEAIQSLMKKQEHFVEDNSEVVVEEFMENYEVVEPLIKKEKNRRKQKTPKRSPLY